MRIAWKTFKLWMAFVFPLWMFDGCANRDPEFWIGKNYQLGAIAPGQPLELSYHVPGQFTEKGPKGFQVDDLRDFQIADIAFRGRGKLPGASIFVTPEYRFFVVDRRANTLHWQDSLADQSSWIVQNLNLEESDFRRLNWWDAQPVNPLFPWNLFYYSIAPLVCFFFAWRGGRRSSSPGSGSHVPPG